MIVNLILTCVCVMSGSSFLLTLFNPDAVRARKAALRGHSFAGLGFGCLYLLGAFAVVALWTAYAVSVADWRFAAIVWVPAVVSLMTQALMYEPTTRRPDGGTRS